MRTLLGLGLTVAAGALFFACAKGDDGVASDDDGGSGTGDDSGLGEKDGASYGGGDGSAKDGGASETDSGPTCVEVDAGCTTSLPGACGAGIIHCDGGAPVCEPAAASAACFTGGATTRNNGVCHDGVQSCSDTTGACTGETTAAAHENCFNNLDDDCDGLINNGCPNSISIGANAPLTARGGGGGGAVSVHCPTGALVTRVDSYFDNDDAKVSGVGIYCATPSLIQGASSYSVTLTPNTPAPYQVQTGSHSNSNQRTDDCGITGLTSMRTLIGNYDTFVEATGSYCGTSTVTLNADNSIGFSFTDASSTIYTGYSPYPGTFARDTCPAGQVIVGYNLHHGAYLDNIQVVCAPLVVNYKAGTPDP
ncbi:MAG: hypothetical protein ABI461_05715 [Polyangiaceae bacterium]